MASAEPVTPLAGNPAPGARPSAHSQVQPVAQPTVSPSTPPRAPSWTAWQTVADNATNRAVVGIAVVAIMLLAKWGIAPGNVAVFSILALALPVELTRQLSKILVARAGGSGGGGGAAVALLVTSAGAVGLQKLLAYGAITGALVAGVSGCPALPPPDGCTPRDQRCHSGAPEVCSPTQRWTPADRPCGELGAGVVCCAVASPYGREVHACVPQGACAAARALADGGVE